MATAESDIPSMRGRVVSAGVRVVDAVGDLGLFIGQTVAWALRGPVSGTLLPTIYSVGVQSTTVVCMTGLFIGMIMAVQTYPEFKAMGLTTHIGAAVNLAIVRELGPVLAAAMLAGRLGSSMAAELGTMRVTDQVDALACLGVNPLRYLVVPRLIACLIMVPLLTILADFVGIMGGAAVSIYVYQVEATHYWINARGFPSTYDLTAGLIKPLCFGAAISLISCHRGLNSSAGAEGVGRAATQAFVVSLLTVLVLDFFLGVMLNRLHDVIWPQGPESLF